MVFGGRSCSGIQTNERLSKPQITSTFTTILVVVPKSLFQNWGQTLLFNLDLLLVRSLFILSSERCLILSKFILKFKSCKDFSTSKFDYGFFIWANSGLFLSVFSTNITNF